MKRIGLLASVGAALVLGVFVVHAATAVKEEAQQPLLVGVLHHADWCGSCKVLDPKLEAVKRDFQDQGVLFTQVDLTDEFTQAQSVLFASWVGYKDVLANNQKTGFMLLVNPATGETMGKLTKVQSEDELRATIGEALEAVKKL